jgi:hypothetical protein
MYLLGRLRQRCQVILLLFRHGKGRLTYQDGKEVKGIWEEGNLVKTENDSKPSYDHEDMPLRRSVKAHSFGYHAARM